MEVHSEELNKCNGNFRTVWDGGNQVIGDITDVYAWPYIIFGEIEGATKTFPEDVDDRIRIGIVRTIVFWGFLGFSAFKGCEWFRDSSLLL